MYPKQDMRQRNLHGTFFLSAIKNTQMKKRIRFWFLQIIIFSSLISCYTMRPSRGGGQISSVGDRKTNPDDIQLAPGYKISVLTDGLTFPSGAVVDDKNELYVVEAGYSYDEVWEEPKLIRISADGSKTVIAKGGKNGPWNGLAFYKGFFYIAEGGELEGGKILRVSPSGEMKVLAEHLPSVGDHHVNGPVILNEHIYFGIGVATNSAVVGPDNYKFGWLKRQKEFHDIPCQDIVLAGENYETDDLLNETKTKKKTGAFLPYGTPSTPGQVIKGEVPCTGAVLRIPLEGGTPEEVAWGFRNPFAFSTSDDGKLYVTENAFDDRGSRPVWGAGDVLWEVKQGAWYGWPDFSAGKPISGKEEFKPPGKAHVKPLLQKYPGTVPHPVAVFGVHSSSNGFDISSSPAFGFAGEAFVAQFGDMAPNVGKVLAPVGFKVVRVNLGTGVIRDFAVNKGKKNGPASMLKTGGLERPVAVVFDQTGNVMYIIDFGILQMNPKAPSSKKGTGVIWKVVKG
jgi:hypothetical protein